MKKKIEFILLFMATVLLPIVVVYSFIQMPLTDDVRVFIGAAHQAMTNNLPFPLNVDAAWELKPLGNRILWYFVTEIGEPSTIQLLSLFAAMLASFLLAGQLSRHIKGQSDLVLITLFFALITPFNLFLMQSEWWAVLLSYLALWLLLREDAGSMVVAGLLVVFIASIKLSTVVMIPTVFIAYLLIAGYSKTSILRNTIPYSAGVVTGIISGIFWLFYLPNTLPDIFFAMSVAHASKGITIAPLESIGYFIYYIFQQFISLPVLLIGFISGLVLLVVCIVLWINNRGKSEPTIHLSLVLLLWLFPCVSVIIQGEFFPYHYMTLAFSAVVSIVLIGNMSPDKWRGVFYLAVIGSITLFWIFHCSIWSPNYPAQEEFWKQMDSDYSYLENTYHLSEQPSILYLTNPDATYWWRVPSACRHPGSLVILYNITGAKEYEETKTCIENYRGEYVIAGHDVENIIPGLGRNETSRFPQTYLRGYARIEEKLSWDIYRRVT